MLYAFNQSHFDCMYATWYANLKKIYRKKLQVLQNKCIRFSLQWNNREQIGTEHWYDKLAPNRLKIYTISFHKHFKILLWNVSSTYERDLLNIQSKQYCCWKSSLELFYLKPCQADFLFSIKYKSIFFN